MDAWNGTFELVDPRLIVCDHRYQREEKEGHIARITSQFDWREFGVIVCSKRDNGVFYAIDGQQRLNAALKLAVPPKTVPVVWFPFVAVEEEARRFTGMNELRKALQPIEKYKSRLVAKDPVALGMARALETAGYSIGYNDDSPRTIGAVIAAQRIYTELGEDGLALLLIISRDAWDDDKLGISAPILHGLCDVAMESNGGFERAKLTTALKRTTPARIMRKADELTYKIGGNKRQNVRLAFKELAKV